MTSAVPYTGIPYELLVGGALGGAVACAGATIGGITSEAGIRCAVIGLAGAYVLKLVNDQTGFIPSQSGITGSMGIVRRVGLGVVGGFGVAYAYERLMQ